MAFRQCFFSIHLVIKIVLRKVLQNFKKPNFTRWPKALNQKPKMFSRLAYNTGRDQRIPTLFFRHCEIFFQKKSGAAEANTVTL